ncbi:8506_t:CDS:2, partial [Paraglomus occultum]
MAKSKFEYVKKFELNDSLLPNTCDNGTVSGNILTRRPLILLHGPRFSDVHDFKKPNDKNALDLMNKCAECVMNNVHDVLLSYGQSDEYSFVLNKECNLYDRRESKIVSTIVSLFTSSYVFYWKNFFPDQELQYPPSFDGRLVQYPSDTNLRDYL